MKHLVSESNKSPTDRQWSRWFSRFLLCFILTSAHSALGQEDVFNNLEFGTEPIPTTFFLDGASDADENRPAQMAQQFLLGENTAISEVSLVLASRNSPQSGLDLELWDDDGSGMIPGDRIALIASLDGLVSGPQSLYTFDANISGLDSNELYYIVISYFDDVEATEIEWEMLGSAEGSFGAERALTRALAFESSPDGPVPTDYDWSAIHELAEGSRFEGTANYFAMSVKAVPEPSSASLLLIAALALFRCRQRGRRLNS